MDTEIYSDKGEQQGEQRVVLVIAHDFPPYGMQSTLRPLKFAKYLGDFNWQTIVLGATPPPTAFQDDHLVYELAGRPVRVYRTGSTIGGMRIVQGKNDGLDYLSGRCSRRIRSVVDGALHQPENSRNWIKEALAVGREIVRVEGVEIILATAPPFSSLLVAHRLSQEFDIPFLVDYRAAWAESDDRFYPTPLHRSTNVRLENDILKLAEKIVVVSRHTKELLLRNYGFLEHNDVRIIPHGYDPDDFAVHAELAPERDRFMLVTTSDFTGADSPRFFLKALKQFLAGNPDARSRISVRFAGLMPKRHAKVIRQYKLDDCVSYYGAQMHTDKVRHIAEAHALWLAHNDNYRLPEELYDYIGSRKPFIAAVPAGVMSTTAQDTLAAVVTRPGHVDDMAEAIGTLYAQWRAGTLPTGREQFTAQFDYRVLAADLSRELGLAMKLV